MTPDELHELAGLLERATQGPWALHAGHKNRLISGTDSEGDCVTIAEVHWWIAEGAIESQANASLIVAAVNALPSLLSDLREAREAIGAFVAKYEECEPHIDGAFQMAFAVRGHQYTGPNYAAELTRLRELARIKELEGR